MEGQVRSYKKRSSMGKEYTVRAYNRNYKGSSGNSTVGAEKDKRSFLERRAIALARLKELERDDKNPKDIIADTLKKRGERKSISIPKGTKKHSAVKAAVGGMMKKKNRVGDLT